MSVTVSVQSEAEAWPGVLASGLGSLDHACRAQQHTSRKSHSNGASGSKVDDVVDHIGLFDRNFCGFAPRRIRSRSSAVRRNKSRVFTP